MAKTSTLLVIALVLILQLSACNPPATTQLPDVQLKDLQGNIVQLSQYAGKPILINFWATWCGPCRFEIPMLNELHKKYSSHGLVILGISTDDDGADVVKEFIRDTPIEYPNLLKTTGVEEKFGGVWALPTNVFYDRNGNQIDKILGLQPRNVFEKKIQQMLKP